MARNIEDWLDLAREDPARADEYLAAATAQASECWEWRIVLEGVVALEGVARERLDAVVERTLATAEVDRELHGFLDVARVRASRLGDTDGARAALEACVQMFLRPRDDILADAAEVLRGEEHTRGYEWMLLAEGYAAIVGDDDEVRRCLREGVDMARAHESADDLTSIAIAWAKHIDRDEGVKLLCEAEALDDDSASPWTLANAWRALDDDDNARRVLDAALAAAASCDDAVHVLRAWASHGRVDEALAAFERGAQLAEGFEQWLALGEAAYDGGLGEKQIRRALACAEAAADPAERGRVSAGYLAWVGDGAAAARVGPRGVAPAALGPASAGLADWTASASGLFDWLRARITPEILEHIARADYGMDAAKHLAALRDICQTGLVPRTLDWEPHEVLALSRWSTGEKVDHVERAWCCTLLCLSPSDLDELVTNGPILLESCLALGDEALAHAVAFFAWLAEREGERRIALMLLLFARAATDPSDARLPTLAGSIDDLPALRGEMDESMRAALWHELIDRLLVPNREVGCIAALLAGLGR